MLEPGSNRASAASEEFVKFRMSGTSCARLTCTSNTLDAAVRATESLCLHRGATTNGSINPISDSIGVLYDRILTVTDLERSVVSETLSISDYTCTRSELSYMNFDPFRSVASQIEISPGYNRGNIILIFAQ